MLSRHTVEPIREASSHTTPQGMCIHLQSHCELIIDLKIGTGKLGKLIATLKRKKLRQEGFVQPSS